MNSTWLDNTPEHFIHQPSGYMSWSSKFLVSMCVFVCACMCTCAWCTCVCMSARRCVHAKKQNAYTGTQGNQYKCRKSLTLFETQLNLMLSVMFHWRPHTSQRLFEWLIFYLHPALKYVLQPFVCVNFLAKLLEGKAPPWNLLQVALWRRRKGNFSSVKQNRQKQNDQVFVTNTRSTERFRLRHDQDTT